MPQAVARRLSDGLRESDTAARLEGDEFTVLLESLTGLRADALAVAEKLLLSIALPVQIGAASVQISASIGIALHPPGSDMSPDQLINAADAAMYAATRAGKSRCWVQ